MESLPPPPMTNNSTVAGSSLPLQSPSSGDAVPTVSTVREYLTNINQPEKIETVQVKKSGFFSKKK